MKYFFNLDAMVRIRIRIRVLILTLILTVDVLPLVTFNLNPNNYFLKSNQVNKILNFPVALSTRLPGLGGSVLVPTIKNNAQCSSSIMLFSGYF